MSRKTTKTLNPFEDCVDLLTLLRIEQESNKLGAYLLSKKNIHDSDSFELIFGYSCRGVHPIFNSEQQLEAAIKSFESGLKDIPQSERFIFRWSSFCDDNDKKEYLFKRLNNPVSSESEFLDWSNLARVQKLTRDKSRKKVSLNIYCSFTVTNNDLESADNLDKLISKIGKFLTRRFTKSGVNKITEKRLIQIFNKAFDRAMRYQQILSEMGLSPQLKSEQDLWKELCERIGANEVKLPHCLVFSSGEIREEINDSEIDKPSAVLGGAHSTSAFLNNGVPFADRRWVCIPHGSNSQKYVGILVLEQKPELFASTQGQLKFLWDIFSRNNIYDVEIITEISPADTKLTRAAQQMILRRARTLDLNVQERRSIDVAAQIDVERSVEAQKGLYTGDIPENLALVVLVYRNSPSEVDDACRLISGYVNQPTELSQEKEYAWLIWLQTLLIKKESLLLRPYNRRMVFFASEALGLTNVVQISPADSQGFELIADEGSSPVYIDLSRTKNILVLGTTGSGKSVLVSTILAECQSLGMSILTIDLPNDDGTGTFGDYTPYQNGFYFDISKESNNLVQPLDLSNIPEKDRKERIKSHRNDVILIVSQLVLGSDSSQNFDGFLAQTIESLIPLGIQAFYEDEDIKKRFELAQQKGIGTPQWDDTPTLADLENFYSQSKINLGYEDDNVDRALKYICLRLKYWRTSTIGNAICRPSTFVTNSNFITFALTNIQSGKDAEIMGLSAYAAASRQSLSSSNSVFFMDEASVLLRFSSLSKLVGRKCATARKSGCRVMLAAQDILSIAKSEAGEQIVQNMPCRLIGRIVPGASKSFNEHLGIPQEIIEKNETFRPNATEMYTKWLLDYQNKYTLCRYYPSAPMLALVANSREEQAARDHFKSIHKNKFEWVSEFAKHYVNCIQSGKPL
ncbi:DUF87 domain-containing protein [Mastigocoleus sp. MO_188.B34]|uniref:helicase HerA domain-containing protein n=1 Tax=Mastigocoleus sp. MO_188.B34 TaxID=3036635 RepID=UPI002621D45E|nr:DUF87 domain-containing protein [Mastigocoleus sp. MO_188.B34]MDJ0696937.1 DUF87 domain-containing protein [Mastigocoleus sp. MO_188.B34]